jgi:hypothetical protein
MDENQNELKRADVARVGVQEDLFGGGAYLYVK